MGLFDSFKKKAQGLAEAVNSAPVAAPSAAPPAAAPPAVRRSAPAPRGSTFDWNERSFPMPAGWADLSIDDWFLKYTRTIDRLSKAHEEDLEPLTDADGEPLSPEEVLLLKLGFQSGNHWESFRSWGVWNWSQKTGEDQMNLEFRMGGIARDRLMAEQAAAMSGPGGLLAPVEGVSLKDWARVYAGVSSGGDMAGLLARAGLDQAKWDRVSAEWMARMTTDTSMTIANEYGAAFAAGSQNSYGQHAAHAATAGVAGDLSSEPMSFERWVEATEAQNAAGQRGEDCIAVLASFGLSVADFSNVSMYWAKRQQQDAMKYYHLYNEYSAKYAAKYKR